MLPNIQEVESTIGIEEGHVRIIKTKQTESKVRTRRRSFDVYQKSIYKPDEPTRAFLNPEDINFDVIRNESYRTGLYNVEASWSLS